MSSNLSNNRETYDVVINGISIHVVVKMREYYNYNGVLTFSTKYDFYMKNDFGSITVVENGNKCYTSRIIGDGDELLRQFQRISG